jgi:hypothetical protein
MRRRAAGPARDVEPAIRRGRGRDIPHVTGIFGAIAQDWCRWPAATTGAGFDPKVGLSVVIAGAVISAGSPFGRDLTLSSVRAAASSTRAVRAPKDLTVATATLVPRDPLAHRLPSFLAHPLTSRAGIRRKIGEIYADHDRNAEIFELRPGRDPAPVKASLHRSSPLHRPDHVGSPCRKPRPARLVMSPEP